MSMWWFCGLVVMCLVFGANGFPEQDLVVRLPGQPEVGFRQYVGYVYVDVKARRSLFYYFVKLKRTLFISPSLSGSMEVEAAYDMLLMQSLSLCRAGKVVSSSIHYADVKPVNAPGMGSMPQWLQGRQL